MVICVIFSLNRVLLLLHRNVYFTAIYCDEIITRYCAILKTEKISSCLVTKVQMNGLFLRESLQKSFQKRIEIREQTLLIYMKIKDE